MAATIFWHDYETFGADPSRDRPCQFAGVRTDMDLNLISDSITLFCSPTEDYLPHPEACLVTGITPQKALREGVAEAEFADEIEKLFSVPETCVAGYNSIRFDDEVTRHLFYRNFRDPYRREWANGNSRWDLIDIVRLVYVLHPEALNWPVNEDGVVSFRLELLTKENGIEHGAAHDAMSDVYATIELAKLIKDRLPTLFEWALSVRSKAKVREQIDIPNLKPLFHVSSKFPASKGCSAVVVPVAEHPTNKNGVLCFDLRQDPSIWSQVDPKEISRRLYSSNTELDEQGLVRPALKTVHLNRCPILLPAGTLRRINSECLEDWGLDETNIKHNLQVIREQPVIVENFIQALSKTDTDRVVGDPDLMLYSGGFFSPQDRAEMSRVIACSAEQLAASEFSFQDSRLPEMLMRYKGRNYPLALNDEEMEAWDRFKSTRLFENEEGFLSFNQFAEKLQSISANTDNSEHLSILEELKYYAESIFPYS